MVYGGLRHGGGLDFWYYLCLCPWDGDADADDLSTDMYGFYFWLCRSGLRLTTSLLQSESDVDIWLSSATLGTEVTQDGSIVLPVVEDDRCCRKVLCGMHRSAALRNESYGCSLFADGSGYGDFDMAVHSKRRHQNAGMDRLLTDGMPVWFITPYYIYSGVRFRDDGR